MADSRLSESSSTARPAVGRAAGQALAPVRGTAPLQPSHVARLLDNQVLATLKEALQLPPRPKDAEALQDWLLDGYRRLLRAEVARNTLQQSWREAKLDNQAYGDLQYKLWDLRRTLDRGDKGGIAKKAFFTGFLPSAQALIDGLRDYPQPPADRAGQEAWLADGKQKLAEGQAAETLIQTVWLSHQTAPLDQQSDAGRLLDEFEERLRKVETDLLLQTVRQESETGALSDQSGKAMASPIAMTLGVLDAITRSFIWLEKRGVKR